MSDLPGLSVPLVWLIAAIVGMGFLYVLLPVALSAYVRFRGERLVSCPENRRPAAVEVDGVRAALTAIAGEPRLRLTDCSRWPKRKDCGQGCLRQIEAAPEDCLIRTILLRWYEGKACALCGRAFANIESWGRKPALLGPDGVTHEWSDIPGEAIPETLETHHPACWTCHLTETLRRLHPERITERGCRGSPEAN